MLFGSRPIGIGGACITLAVLLGLVAANSWAQSRGVKYIRFQDRQGQTVGEYRASYALLIGVSDYTAGWPDLETVPAELRQLETSLQNQGFQVTRHLNPDATALERAFERFIDRHGFTPDNRLLIFFSGHGHTRRGGRRGYLVPADAPNPQHDEHGFLHKALSMEQILAWAREIEARHALFLFDSCFSGTVFKTKTLPKKPPYITRLTALPVRLEEGQSGYTPGTYYLAPQSVYVKDRFGNLALGRPVLMTEDKYREQLLAQAA